MDEQRNVAAARSCYEAYVTRDRVAIEALIADDFHFTSPLDNRIDRNTYFKRCWTGSEGMEDYEFVNLVPVGDRVFVTYEVRIRGGRRFRNTEILTFRNGQLVDAEVYFGWSLPHQAAEGRFIDKGV
jgi:ketosteroid isomerase-like protein